jgi:hypothetical protein
VKRTEGPGRGQSGQGMILDGERIKQVSCTQRGSFRTRPKSTAVSSITAENCLDNFSNYSISGPWRCCVWVY